MWLMSEKTAFRVTVDRMNPAKRMLDSIERCSHTLSLLDRRAVADWRHSSDDSRALYTIVATPILEEADGRWGSFFGRWDLWDIAGVCVSGKQPVYIPVPTWGFPGAAGGTDGRAGLVDSLGADGPAISPWAHGSKVWMSAVGELLELASDAFGDWSMADTHFSKTLPRWFRGCSDAISALYRGAMVSVTGPDRPEAVEFSKKCADEYLQWVRSDCSPCYGDVRSVTLGWQAVAEDHIEISDGTRYSAVVSIDNERAPLDGDGTYFCFTGAVSQAEAACGSEAARSIAEILSAGGSILEPFTMTDVETHLGSAAAELSENVGTWFPANSTCEVLWR